MPRQEFRVLSPTAMAALILPGGVSTSSATECHSRTHFFRRLHFRHQPKLSLIVSVPLPHFAWTARPSTVDLEFGSAKLHARQLRNFCRQLPNQVLLLDESALCAGRIRFRFDVHDVVARPFGEAVNTVNEGALLRHESLYPSRTTSFGFLSSRKATKRECRR